MKITPIEYKILHLLISERGKVFSIDQIYESIWQQQAVDVENIVAVHIRHLREKIEIAPIPKPFKGVAIAFIIAGFMAMAFAGLAGIA